MRRLLTRIDAVATSSIGDPLPLLICAPAGYGKTRLVNAWLATQNPEHIVRMRCYPGGARTIWRDLLVALRPYVGPSQASAEEALDALRLRIHTLDTPLTLEIDDYHLATSTENDLALLDLINPKLRLIVVARRVTVLNGPLAARRIPVVCIGIDELSYTPEEARGYAEKFGLPSEAQLTNAIELANGWPLAIRAALGPAPGATLMSGDEAPKRTMEPLAALNRFTQLNLEALRPLAQQALLASATVDAIDHAQIAALAQVPTRDARRATNELTELGLLVPAASGNIDEFSCHTAIRASLQEHLPRAFTLEQVASLQRTRADKIAAKAPFAAVRLYLVAGAYEDAEIELANHFVTLTDEREEFLRMVYSIPNDAAEAHPTFLAARLYLEFSDPDISPSALWLLIRRWLHAFKIRTKLPVNHESLRTAYTVQAMVQERVLGHLASAQKLAKQLQSQLVTANGPGIVRTLVPSHGRFGLGARKVIGSGSYPLYFLELASTMLALGDFDNAKRAWEKLQQHAEALIEHPWYGFAPASIRTVTDVESGQRWRLAALYERSFTEALDGDMALASELLDEADEFRASTCAAPAGLSWVSGETVRAHLAAGSRDAELLRAALDTVEPVFDRMERWPLFLVAEAELARAERGVGWALQQFESKLAQIKGNRKSAGAWHTLLTSYQAMLNTLLGRFSESKRIINTLPEEAGGTLLERARLALFHEQQRESRAVRRAGG